MEYKEDIKETAYPIKENGECWNHIERPCMYCIMSQIIESEKPIKLYLGENFREPLELDESEDIHETIYDYAIVNLGIFLTHQFK